RDRVLFLAGSWACGACALSCFISRAMAEDAAKVKALTGAYNESGQQLFKSSARAPGNIVFSPYSIGTAMAMALAGASADTEREMAVALKHRLARSEIADANADALAVLNGYGRRPGDRRCPSPETRRQR